MTVMTMLLGLGGLVSSFLLELIVYPAIYAVWKRCQLRAQADLIGGL